MLAEWMAEYQIHSAKDELNARREIFQEITLAGLSRGKFFEKASFYGGTALRIFYGLDRFSEDLDFTLNEADKDFSLASFLQHIKNEFQLLGLNVSLQYKSNNGERQIDSAFLKSDTVLADLSIFDKNNLIKTLKIKIEVDTIPPLKFEVEPKLLFRPYSFYVNVLKKEYLFAGKLHALLFRNWKKRVKGRDWYDFEWYILNRIPLNITHFAERAYQSGSISEKNITSSQIVGMIIDKIDQVNMDDVKLDVERFIASTQKLDIWSRQYFKDLVAHIKFTE
jgi:predicted nucleotidyltransferase component of viral defense system